MISCNNLIDDLCEMADADAKEVTVTRGEYRFLLMEYTRMGLELAEHKEKYESLKRILYAALKDWSIYHSMSREQRSLLDELAEEFELETENQTETETEWSDEL